MPDPGVGLGLSVILGAVFTRGAVVLKLSFGVLEPRFLAESAVAVFAPRARLAHFTEEQRRLSGLSVDQLRNSYCEELAF